MQRGDFGKQGGSTRGTDLRAQLRANAQKPEKDLTAKPPKPRKDQPVDVHEERAAKAEKHASIQHSTSLLTKEPKNSRARAYKEPKRGDGGFLFQLIVVVAVAVVVAYALDPTIADSIDWRALKDMVGLKS